jgi:hypothetical protein
MRAIGVLLKYRPFDSHMLLIAAWGQSDIGLCLGSFGFPIRHRLCNEVCNGVYPGTCIYVPKHIHTSSQKSREKGLCRQRHSEGLSVRDAHENPPLLIVLMDKSENWILKHVVT